MNRIRSTSIVFYALICAGLLGLVFKLQYLVVSEALGVRIGHNSEVLGLVLLICLLVQYVRPWALKTATTLRVVAVFVVLAACYLVLNLAVPITTVSTLDECFSGAAYVWIYMMIPKRYRSVPIALVLVLLVIVVFFNTEFITAQAESLIPLLIAPIALDLIDKTILEPELPDRRVLRIVWMIVLAGVGLMFMALAPWARQHLDDVLTYAIDYGQRSSEAYWSWILIHLYFGFLLPPHLRRAQNSSV